MANGKKGFMLYTDLIHTVEKLSKEQAGELFLHILKYVNDKNPILDNLILEIAFEPIKQQLKRDLEKYNNTIEVRKEAGKLGGQAKKANAKQNLANLANAKSAKQNLANLAVIDKEKIKRKIK